MSNSPTVFVLMSEMLGGTGDVVSVHSSLKKARNAAEAFAEVEGKLVFESESEWKWYNNKLSCATACGEWWLEIYERQVDAPPPLTNEIK